MIMMVTMAKAWAFRPVRAVMVVVIAVEIQLTGLELVALRLLSLLWVLSDGARSGWVYGDGESK